MKLKLKRSRIQGIGVFALVNIKRGTYLEPLLFPKGNTQKKKNPSKEEKEYCIKVENRWICPKNFHQMSVGWFLNHSSKPNLAHNNLKWYSIKNIRKGEELTIDYKTVGETKPPK